MFRSILVPLDGSRFSEVALPVATRLARSAGARLRLVMVHEPAMALVPAADVPVPYLPDDAELRAKEQTYLADLATRLGPVGPALASSKVVDGMAGPALAEAIMLEPPDLVVMATHGRGPLSRFWLGSVADHVVRHVSVPVLLLRPKDGAPVPPAELRIQSIAVALDLSDEAEKILEPVKALAVVTQAHLTLVHVVEPVFGVSEPALPYPVPVDPGLLETRKLNAQKYLDQLADRLRAEGLRVATRVIMGMGAATMLLELAQKERFDLIAIATHGWGGIKRFLLGSVADKVIRAAEKPVLVLRPPH